MSNVPFAAQMEELAAYMASKISVPTIGIGGGYAPIGTIISYMGTTAPQDYLACDGSTKNIADYPQLAEFFAAQFGSANFFGGNGTTTFAVPDLRGEFLRGTGTNSHANQGSGANVGEHQDGTEHMNDGTTTDDYEAFHMSGTPIKTDSLIGNAVGRYVSMSSTRTGSRATHFTSRPTNTSILYCIKAVCAGEVYSTDERVVGTWVDGKPLYQKTFVKDSLTNNDWNTELHGIANIDQVINTFGGVISTTTGGFNAEGYFGSGGIETYASRTRVEIYVNMSGLGAANKGYVTMQYTKTTD